MIISKKLIKPKHYRDQPRFEAVTTGAPLTRTEQAEIQREFGYDPAGYGIGRNIAMLRTGTDEYENFWYCSHTCD
jgi:hypothetical protein